MCISPYIVKDEKTARYLPVPCGKCLPCVNKRINGWAFRIQQENKISESADFITLTYGTNYVPITENGYLTTDKTDLQKFFKRLRKYHGKEDRKKIRYYAIQEYGDKTFRPHYHILMFNHNIIHCEQAWRFGHIHRGLIEDASIKYCTGYFNKESKIPMFENDDREKERSFMSKGLGQNYITAKTKAWHKADLVNRCYVPGKGGQKYPMPRYYRNKIYTESERKTLQKHFEQKAIDELAWTQQELKEHYEYNQAMAAKLQNRKLKTVI